MRPNRRINTRGVCIQRVGYRKMTPIEKWHPHPYIILYFLSCSPVEDRAGPWNTAMNASCVLHITTALLHRSCSFYCFQLFSRLRAWSWDCNAQRSAKICPRTVAYLEGPLPGGGATKSAQAPKGEGAGGGIPSCRSGPGGLPRVFFKWMQELGSESIRCRLRVLSPQPLYVFFAVKAPLYVMREKVDLSCIGAYRAKTGSFFYCFEEEGGGSGSPQKLFEKWMQMVHSYPIFCRLRVDFSQKLFVNYSFKSPISWLTWCGRIFTLAVEDHIEPKIGVLILSQ